jgi:hypothetical protein
MRKLIYALVVAVAACLAAAAAAAADPGPIQVSGQSAGTSQQATAASGATQIDPSNSNISIRVLSPGSDGAVTQSNNAASSAAAGNQSTTGQSANQSAGGSGIQTAQQAAGTDQLAAALSAANQVAPSNSNIGIRVLSPGNDGSVSQSNNAASRADAGNAASTTQSGSQSQAGSSCGCSGSTPVQTSDQSASTDQAAAALSAANQIDPSNSNVSIRVLSPGDGGSVTQSNNAASSANAGNHAATTQGASQSQAGGCGCGAGGTAIQQANQAAGTEQDALAGSEATQVDPSNDASPVRVLSPGSDGSVSQSNNAASSAHSGNDAATTQNANQSQAGESCGCGGGLGIQALGQQADTEQSSAALSGAFQLFGGEPSRCGCGGGASGNTASPVRVWSPGSDGSVDQSNNAASSATAGNRAATTQNGTQSESGSGIQVLGQQAETAQDAFAASLAAQLDPSNNASPVRVWSPGGAGSVTQSNRAASSAAAGNDASTSQDGRQSIAGKPCGCAQLPIQVAGQWAGTAQLAPAFSAALQGRPSNDAGGTSVWSPGTAGALAQSNGAASRGDAGTGARSTQGVSQAA